VLVEEGQGGGSLVDADELVGAFEDILGFLMGWRRLWSQRLVSIENDARHLRVARLSISKMDDDAVPLRGRRSSGREEGQAAHQRVGKWRQIQ